MQRTSTKVATAVGALLLILLGAALLWRRSASGAEGSSEASQSEVSQASGAQASAASGATGGSTQPQQPKPPRELLPMPGCWQGVAELDKTLTLANFRQALAAAISGRDRMLATYLQEKLTELVGDDSSRALQVLEWAEGASMPELGVYIEAVKATAAVQRPEVVERLLKMGEDKGATLLNRGAAMDALETQKRFTPATLARVKAVALDESLDSTAWVATRTIGRVMKEDYERTGTFAPYWKELMDISEKSDDMAVRLLALEMPTYSNPLIGGDSLERLDKIMRTDRERDVRGDGGLSSGRHRAAGQGAGVLPRRLPPGAGRVRALGPLPLRRPGRGPWRPAAAGADGRAGSALPAGLPGLQAALRRGHGGLRPHLAGRGGAPQLHHGRGSAPLMSPREERTRMTRSSTWGAALLAAATCLLPAAAGAQGGALPLQQTTCSFSGMVQELRGALKTGSPAYRRYALEQLKMAAKALPPEELLAAVEQEREPDVLEALGKALASKAGFVENPALVQPLLQRALGDADPNLRAAAVKGLRATGSVDLMARNDNVVTYEQLIRDSSPEVREAVVGNLLEENAKVYFGHDKAVSEAAVNTALASSDPELAAKLLREVSMEQVGSETVSKLTGQLRGENPTLRAASATALGGVPGPESAGATGSLVELYRNEKDPAVRKATLEGLVRLGMSGARPTLQSLRGVAPAMDPEIDAWLAALNLNLQEWSLLLREKQRIRK